MANAAGSSGSHRMRQRAPMARRRNKPMKLTVACGARSLSASRYRPLSG
jgi:hypothetical protein